MRSGRVVETDVQHPGKTCDPADSLILGDCADSVWRRYQDLGTATTFERGETIYSQGQTATEFYLLARGRVHIYILRPDGTQRVLGIAEPGSTFGESSCFDGLPYYASAVALARTCVRSFSRSWVLGMVDEDPDLLAGIFQALVRKQRQLAMQVATGGLKAEDRLLLLMNHLTGAYGQPMPDGTIRLQMHLSTEELAHLIGLTRVTISRELSAMVQRGIIRKQKWDIVILDPEALRVNTVKLL
jgi:CRP/FNR family cyclic AMP-dependent transcriptional regulator